MDVLKANVVDPELEVLSMLRDIQLMAMNCELESKVAFKLLLVSAELAISKHSSSSRKFRRVNFDCTNIAIKTESPDKLLFRSIVK